MTKPIARTQSAAAHATERAHPAPAPRVRKKRESTPSTPETGRTSPSTPERRTSSQSGISGRTAFGRDGVARRLEILPNPYRTGNQDRKITEIARRVPQTPWYLSLDGTELYEYHRPADTERDDETERERADNFQPVNLWGAPKLCYAVQLPGEKADEGRRVWYRISIDDIEHDISYEALHSGKGWEHWPTVAVSSRKDVDRYVSVVINQLHIRPDVPIYEGRNETGWTRAKDGRNVYAFPDGRLLSADGVLAGEIAHMIVSENARKPYDGIPAPDASREAQQGVLDFLATVTTRSIAPIAFAANIRSLFHDIWPADYMLIVRGTTQLGKSSLTSWLRNITGNFPGWPLPPATVSFKDTGASWESALAELRSHPATIDDLVISLEAPEHDKREAEQKLELIIRATADQKPVRRRMRSDMTRRQDFYIRLSPVITAETLPGMNQSLMARSLLLQLHRANAETGEPATLDRTQLERECDTHAPALRTLGWGILRMVAGQLDSEGCEALAARWRERWRMHRENIRHDLLPILAKRGLADGDMLPDEITRLPGNGAHILLALDILAEYTEREQLDNPIIPEVIYPDLIAHLAHQAGEIDKLARDGGMGEPFREWIPRMLRDMFARKDAHLTAQNGEGLTADTAPVPLADIGYDAMNTPRGVALGAYRVSRFDVALKSEELYTLLKRAAERERERRPFPPSLQAFYTALERDGMIAKPAKGQHSAIAVKIANKTTRCVILPASVLWPELLDRVETAESDA